MPVMIDSENVERISLQDFIHYVEDQVDLNDPEGLVSASDQFRALANNADLVADHFNSEIKRYFEHGTMAAYGPQSIVLGGGRGFFLRANVWVPLKFSGAFRAQEERLYSYGNTHDHNFTFMTIGYFGPGYTTDLYTYDPALVQGYVGEQVNLEFVERTHLSRGSVMLYREKVDVHTQYPPESLSISLNVMIASPRALELDQYFFDAKSKRIIGMPDFATIHKRASVIAMAGSIANAETIEIIVDLLDRAPCRRVREAAVGALSYLTGITPSTKARLLERAMNDSEAIVRDRARELLESITA